VNFQPSPTALSNTLYESFTVHARRASRVISIHSCSRDGATIRGLANRTDTPCPLQRPAKYNLLE